jgi:hypothetical protein
MTFHKPGSYYSTSSVSESRECTNGFKNFPRLGFQWIYSFSRTLGTLLYTSQKAIPVTDNVPLHSGQMNSLYPSITSMCQLMDLMCLKRYEKYHHELLTTLSEEADDGDCMLEYDKESKLKDVINCITRLWQVTEHQSLSRSCRNCCQKMKI